MLISRRCHFFIRLWIFISIETNKHRFIRILIINKSIRYLRNNRTLFFLNATACQLLINILVMASVIHPKDKVSDSWLLMRIQVIARNVHTLIIQFLENNSVRKMLTTIYPHSYLIHVITPSRQFALLLQLSYTVYL